MMLINSGYKFWISFLLILASFVANAQLTVYMCRKGLVKFNSVAPLETIEATSSDLKGALDPATKNFAFNIRIRSFTGFNSPLQKEHFNENYLESSIIPTATFKGKIIESVNFSKDGTYSVRAKGVFEIHGMEQETIIKGNMIIKGDNLFIHATFPVMLSDYNIIIPRVVKEKIALSVEVSVDIEMKKELTANQ